MPPIPSDPLLALRAGDPAPFEQFVRARARTLIAFFRQRGAGHARAEDLAQEVFLKLYRNAGRYRTEESFPAYCFRLARNVWIDDCRRSGARVGESDGSARVELPDVEVRGPHCDPGARILLEEEGRRLCDLLAALSASQRAVFELAVLGELTYAEIASILSIPVGTVKSRMFYALRRVRSAFEGRRRREGVA